MMTLHRRRLSRNLHVSEIDLPLNLPVRELSGMNKSLLILDEATDGLSYAQVLNLREVFDALDCDQIILVSHEGQFLSFADNAFQVTKVNGVS